MPSYGDEDGNGDDGDDCDSDGDGDGDDCEWYCREVILQYYSEW